jgi:flavorubredoxin
MITNTQFGTTVDEIAPSTYRISTPIDIPSIPGGFSFSQFLIVDEEPLLFHTGPRRLFPVVSEAVSKVMALDKLRHISYSHFEADESGSMNEFLSVCPNALPLTGYISAMVAMNDIADRPGRALQNGEEVKIGKRTLQWIDTPHIPHGWDCGVLFDKTNGTLFCGDLFTQAGSKHTPVTESDILGPSEMMRGAMDYFAHGRNTGVVLEQLAALQPKLVACMHGSTYRGDGAALIRGLRDTLLRSGVQ